MRNTKEIQADLSTVRMQRARLRIDVAEIEGRIQGLEDELEYAEHVEAHTPELRARTVGLDAVRRLAD